MRLMLIMKPSWWIVVLAVMILAIVGGGFRWWIRRRSSASVDLRHLFERDVASAGVKWDTYEAVATAMGRAYGLHPAWLQPHEPLKKVFDIDSWDLGAGTEAFEKMLEAEFGIAKLNPIPTTLLDLLIVVEQRTREREQRQ
jgi:hypothetical protein